MKHPLQLAPLPGEQHVMIIRRHWFLLVRRAIVFFFLAIVPFLPLAVFPGEASSAIADRTPLGVVYVLAATVFFLFLSLYILHAWVDYDLDVWILSNRRIVNIEQRGLFSRVISELYLDKVQDITTETHGVIPTAMRFGDVHIQTAGENPRFLFDDVPNPAAIAEKIMELHRTYSPAPAPTSNETWRYFRPSLR